MGATGIKLIPNAARVGVAWLSWMTLAASAEAAPSAARLIECGRFVDVVAGELRRDVRIVIDGERVQAVESLEQPASVTGTTVSLRDYTCLPGLIDLHVHLTEQPEDTADLTVYFRRTHAEQGVISSANAAATLRAGFTTVRNLGAYINGVDLALRDAIARGDVLGPRMQVSGYYLTIPGGGGDLLVPSVPEAATPNFVRSGVARGPEQFRAKAERAVASDVDLLKVIASGAVLAYGGVPGAPEMNVDELRAVVSVAHAKGIRVAAHAHGSRSIQDAIDAGVDTIEHASLIDSAAIARASAVGTPLVMDVYNGDYIDTEGRRLGWPAEFLKNNTDTTELQRVAFTQALAAGATIAYGTDAGVFPHGQNARQFRIMVARGMTPLQAIRSATIVAARAMGWDDRVGTLAPGQYADVIAVRGDPLVDITVLEHVSAVIRGGQVVTAP
jgi:imidazolonepropionase-like amidohydrolase